MRAVRPEDWEEHYNNRFDTPARRLLDYQVELPPTMIEAKSFTEEFAYFSNENGRIMFTIESLSCENLGGINLNSIDERNGTFSIGIQINHDHRGNGYGTRAMRILLRYAFFERRLHKFNVSVLEGNDASSMMMRKLEWETNYLHWDKICLAVDEVLIQVPIDEWNADVYELILYTF